MAEPSEQGGGVSGGDERAAILAELSAEPAAPVEAAAVEAEPVVEAEPDADAEPVEAAAEVDEDADAEPDEDDDEDASTGDPATDRKLDAVRKAEKRSRARLEADRAAFDAERREHAAQVARVAEFEQLARRAKYDPAAALRALGLADEDFEIAAHSLYAESKAGQADPKQKAAAMARLKEREKDDKLSATEKRMADLEAKLEQQAQAAAAQAAAAQYMSEINTAAVKHPLVQHMLKADPHDTTEAIVATYDRLAQQTGKVPTAAAVVAAFSKAQTEKLKRLGIDPTTIVKAKPAAPIVAKAAANSNKAAGPAPTFDSEKDEILASLHS